MGQLRVLAVTGSRADWGLLSPLLRKLRDDARFDLALAVTGQHLEQGEKPSLAEIAADGFHAFHQIDMKLTRSDGPAALAAGMGRATAGVGALLADLRPDMVILLGDRYEILAAASAALISRVPIAHICGGDVTEGAMDDSIRHAITKLSALHFVTTEDAARRVAQMGENPEHIFNVGSPGLDRIREVPTLDKQVLWAELGLNAAKASFLVAFHPATLSDNVAQQVDELTRALDHFPDAALIVTGSNADPDAGMIDQKMKAYVATRRNAVFRTSLGSQRFFSALRAVDVMIGNSSSGLYEAPSFGIPTVNIGNRQARRVRASSVIDCDAQCPSIVMAVRKALSMDCTGISNPYGDGHAADRIVEALARTVLPSKLVAKSFLDMTP